MQQPPSFRQAIPVWLKIGCIGFGGPSGQIALLHSEIVEKRNWVSDDEFLRALQFCMLLPGPEAQQLATYLGWRLHGLKGGIVAGTFFFLPAAFLLWLLSLLSVNGQHWPWLMAFLEGIKPAVVAIVISAGLRFGKRTVSSIRLVILALLALLLLSFTHLPYPLLIFGFGLVGAIFIKSEQTALGRDESTPFNWLKTAVISLSIIVLWMIPLLLMACWLGAQSIPLIVGLQFAKVAVVSFGGAYAALSYVSLHAAGDWGWISPEQMMDGLGLAETTPGPLLIALQFVAFLAAYKAPGILSPLLSATLASFAACWSLFLPSFLWIFTLAPHMERLARNPRIAGSLTAIGAVVTAVIIHLALWFAGSLFFPHGITGTIGWIPLLMSMGAFLLLKSQRLGMIPVILVCGAGEVVLKYILTQ